MPDPLPQRLLLHGHTQTCGALLSYGDQLPMHGFFILVHDNKFTADCQSSADGYAEFMTLARSIDPSAFWAELRTENDHKVGGTIFAEISQGTTCYHNY